MQNVYNVLVLAVGALLLLLLAKGWGGLKGRWLRFDQFVSSSPGLERLAFLVAAAGLASLARWLTGAVLPPELEARLPTELTSILLGLSGGAVGTGSYAMGKGKDPAP